MIVHVQNQILTHHGQSDQRNISSGKGENHKRQAPPATRGAPCPAGPFRPREPAAPGPPWAIPVLLGDPNPGRGRGSSARSDPAPGCALPARPHPGAAAFHTERPGDWGRPGAPPQTQGGTPPGHRSMGPLPEMGSASRLHGHPSRRPSRVPSRPPPEGSPTPALTRPWRRRCRFSRTALTDGRPRRAPFSPLAARDGGGGTKRAHWLIPPSAAFPPMGRRLRPEERGAERLTPLKGRVCNTAPGLSPGTDGRKGSRNPARSRQPLGAGKGQRGRGLLALQRFPQQPNPQEGGRPQICASGTRPRTNPQMLAADTHPGASRPAGAVQLSFPLSFN